VGFRASYLGKTLLIFFPLGLVNPIFLIVEPLFISDLIKLFSLKINSNLLAPLLLIELLILIKLTALIGELLFISSLIKLILALLILEIGLIFIKGLVKFIILIIEELIFIDGLVLLALLNYLAKSPFMEFSSLKLF